MDVNGELKLALCLTVLRFIIVTAYMAGTQTTHTHYFSLCPRFLMVNTSFAHIDAVIIPFKATAVKPLCRWAFICVLMMKEREWQSC